MDRLYELALWVKAAQRELERLMNQAMQPLGLTAAQADALAVIGQAGPLALKDLGDLLIAEAGHPSRLVDRLVEAGLVERRPSEEDRRRVELSLTARGRRLEKRILATREEVMALFRQMLAGHDFDSTLELLRDVFKESPYVDLIARRLALLERGAGARG